VQKRGSNEQPENPPGDNSSTPPRPPIPLPKRGPEAIAAFNESMAKYWMDACILKYGTKWKPSFFRQIDDWGKTHGIERSEAIRRLVELGLKAKSAKR
jgi:hypothetical protein